MFCRCIVVLFYAFEKKKNFFFFKVNVLSVDKVNLLRTDFYITSKKFHCQISMCVHKQVSLTQKEKEKKDLEKKKNVYSVYLYKINALESNANMFVGLMSIFVRLFQTEVRLT